MNAKPHAHELEIDTGFSENYTYVRYGDQVSSVGAAGWFYGARLRFTMRRIVKQHDRQSIKAGRRDIRVQEAVSGAIEFDPGQWGSKQKARKGTK